MRLALIGLALSLYTLHVTRNAGRENYTPLCDIAENISCTRAFTSPSGRTLGLHNAWLGITYYGFVLLTQHTLPLAAWIASLLALAKTVELAYTSYARMHNFCLVCTTTYVVNVWLVILLWPTSI